NNIIRKITSGGVVSTLAGVAGSGGFTDGTGSGALFHLPNGLAADSSGNIYVADTANSTIRKIAPGGVVTTLAGLPTIAGLQNGTGSNALFNQPEDLTVDSAGNVYVADTGNAAIREITPAGAVTTLAVPNKAFIASPVASSPAPNSPTPSSGGGGGGGAFDDWFLAALAVASLLRLRPGQT
ncbi:MAG: SMP-30/gluconolactonase/LRE family protein, partial [Opitutaceae bacterium]